MKINENKMTKEPAYRFSGYTDAWEQRKLGEVAEFFDEKRIPLESSVRKKGNYPYYGATGVIDFVDDYIFDGEYVLLAEDGANITMRTSPIAYITSGKFWVNNHAHIMKMIEGSNFFLLQQLEKLDYTKYNSGTAQPKLNGATVKKINICFPDSSEQTAIGTFFQTLDRSIALHQRKLDSLKEQKKTYLQKLFPRNGETIPEIRLHGFKGEWGKANLGDFLKEYNEKSVKENQYDVLSSTNNGIEKRNGRVSGESNIGYKILKKEMIVLSPQNLWLGNINYNSDYDIGLVSPSYKIYGLQNIDKLFMSVLIRHPYMYYEYGQASVQGASIVRRNLDLELFKTIQISIPTLAEQTAIGTFFQTLDRSIAQYQTKLDKLKESKQTLLKKMFI